MYIKHLKGKVCRYFWSRNADHLVKAIQFYLNSTFKTTNFDKGVLLITPYRATGASYHMLSNLLGIAVLHLLYQLNYQRALSADSWVFTQNAVKLLAWLPCWFESHDFFKLSFKFDTGTTFAFGLVWQFLWPHYFPTDYLHYHCNDKGK